MLRVYYQDRVVGHIEEVRPGLTFIYAPDWLAAADSFAISVTMPLRPERYEPDIATPWFANLLPEDEQLVRIGRILGRDQGDVYGFLMEIGRETAGALAIGEPERPGQADYRELSETDLSDVIDRLPQRPLLAGEEGVTLSLAGAQTKQAVAIFDGRIMLPLYGAASTHIMKPASERLYASVENELLCMRLAGSVGIAVAPVSMDVANGHRYLMVERYDRKLLAGQHVARDHQEDFCQAMKLYPTEKYQARHGPGLAELFATIDRHTRTPARDRLRLLDLVIFACCIGDTDRHGKNYSLILTGGIRLAPGYDLMSALGYEGITKNLAMRIGGVNRAQHIEERHWQRFAKEVGLAPAAVVQRVEQLANEIDDCVVSVSEEIAAQFPADGTALRMFADAIAERARVVARNSRRNEKAVGGAG